MKGTIILGALSLAGIAAAQPSGHRRHEHLHEKRQVVTEVDYVTASAPDAVVYVDSNGNVLYTSYPGQAQATSAAGAASAAVSSVVSVAAVATSAAASVYSQASSAVASVASSAASSAASSGSSSSGASGLNGISYSPYSGSYSDGNVGCKTSAQVSADFANIPSSYNMVRIYGTDCNQVENVLAAAKSKNMKVFAGVYDITQVASEISTIVSAANGDWSAFDTISIGNELVNSGTATVSAVTSAIGTARSLLGAAGYTGKIVTVDTFVAVKANPALCEASDYAAVNAHPFFDGGVEAANSGPWVLEQMQAVSAACGGKNTMVTETGWPSAGQSNGDAVPSTSNQQAAIASIKKSVSSNVVMFTAFNDMWKAPGYLSVEQSWGVYGNSAAS